MKSLRAANLDKLGGKVKSKAARANSNLGGRVLSEKIDSFGIPLLEMANAIQKYTGLPGVVYFSTKIEAGLQKGLGRVKWSHGGKEVFITIKAASDGKRRGSGDKRMLAMLERFVVANEDLLWRYWNTSPEEADSSALMNSFVRVNS